MVRVDKSAWVIRFSSDAWDLWIEFFTLLTRRRPFDKLNQDKLSVDRLVWTSAVWNWFCWLEFQNVDLLKNEIKFNFHRIKRQENRQVDYHTRKIYFSFLFFHRRKKKKWEKLNIEILLRNGKTKREIKTRDNLCSSLRLEKFRRWKFYNWSPLEVKMRKNFYGRFSSLVNGNFLSLFFSWRSFSPQFSGDKSFIFFTFVSSISVNTKILLHFGRPIFTSGKHTKSIVRTILITNLMNHRLIRYTKSKTFS